jgi:hypothetical protein
MISQRSTREEREALIEETVETSETNRQDFRNFPKERKEMMMRRTMRKSRTPKKRKKIMVLKPQLMRVREALLRTTMRVISSMMIGSSMIKKGLLLKAYKIPRQARNPL